LSKDSVRFAMVDGKPTLVLSASIYEKYAKIAELAGVPLETLVNAVLEEAVKGKLDELKSKMPELTATTRR
jgi:hypothetical protein